MEGSRTLAGRRVLFTGAGGQLGGYLPAALRALGAEPIAAGHREGPGVDIAADLTLPGAAPALIARTRPDAVIHAAAWTDVDGAERDPGGARAMNADAAGTLAAACREAGVHLVAVSTDFVFSGRGGAPYAEDAPADPVSVYGQTKREGELAVLAADPGFAVARTAWLYGGHGKHFPRTVLAVLAARGAIEVVDDEAGSPTFAGDLAGALGALVAARGAGVFHLVNAGRATRFGLAREVARLAGFPPGLVTPTSTAEFLRKYPLPAARPADSELRNLRAAALGIVLRPWEQAAADYVPRLARDLGLPAH
ncbi:MAG: dTDP-4-dehydrorhamnose reductase [Chloroflexota bacterium]